METYISVLQPGDARSVEDVRALLLRYLDWLGPVVCSTTLPQEIASLPNPYAPPGGALFIARDSSGSAVGCVGIRAGGDAGACEVKRLYVREDMRGQGVARALVRAAMDQARALGYVSMRLTTLPDDMPDAAALYRSLGFSDVDPFTDHGGVPGDMRVSYMSRGL